MNSIEEDDDKKTAQRFDQILANLSDEDRVVVEKVQAQQKSVLIRATISQVMARNNSHNLGSTIGGKTD